MAGQEAYNALLSPSTVQYRVMITVDEVSTAMDRHELRVEYLPTIRLSDKSCVGAEALVRWQRGQVVVYGGDFVPSIENTPLSGRLTYWVIDTVAAELGDWLGSHPDVHVSINVPPELLGRGGLEYAAQHSGLAAHIRQVVLEITERGIPDALGLEALNRMAQRGVRLALDDTALSGVNVALLARCNFSILKIDRSLVAQLAEGAAEPAWLSGLASLLGNSNLQVVAEGVECDYQASELVRAGVQLAQGYLYSPAVSAGALADFYVQHSAH